MAGFVAQMHESLKDILVAHDPDSFVYDYIRWTSDLDDFLDVFRSGPIGTDQKKKVQGWAVQWVGQQPRITAARCMLRLHEFNINFYLGHDDATASEKIGADLLEDMCDALDKDKFIHQQDMFTEENNFAAVVTYGTLPFGDVLAHFGQIKQFIAEQKEF